MIDPATMWVEIIPFILMLNGHFLVYRAGYQKLFNSGKKRDAQTIIPILNDPHRKKCGLN